MSANNNSSSSHVLGGDVQEQICYVHCGFCTTVLLVSVPCSSLTQVVTVRCGHCTTLLSVNMMMRASFLPLPLFSSLNQAHHDNPEPTTEDKAVLDHHHPPAAHEKGSESTTAQIPPPVFTFPSSSDDEEEEEEEEEEETKALITKPPEKRQRAPSAYNLFIGQEIHRLKAIYPTMTHKQAFSMAAKNWAHSPVNEPMIQGDQKDAAVL